MHGRDHVLPEDIQAIFPAVVNHRLQRITEAEDGDSPNVAAELLTAVPIP